MSKKDDSKHAVLEETGTAFDPTVQHLDLSKDEKRRTTALLMAIQAYQNLIIKDADYLREAADQARRNEGPKIQPATMNAMVEAAFQFDDFISGRSSNTARGTDIASGGAALAVTGDAPLPDSGDVK